MLASASPLKNDACKKKFLQVIIHEFISHTELFHKWQLYYGILEI